MHESLLERYQRYPHGYRKYENYANYSIYHPEATIKEYMETMNRQTEFHEFLDIQT